MPPRPHPLVLASLAFGCAVVMALVLPHHAAGASGWRWPLRGPVVGAFHVTPRAPFGRGQRRGIDVSAPPGAVVRAACPGRVTFTGALPHRGLAVTVRSGSLIATHPALGQLATRAGSRLGRGDGIGTLGASGRLRLGARRASDRRGYVDPLLLLADGAPPLRFHPPPPPPRAPPPRPPPPPPPAPRPIAPATPPAPGPATPARPPPPTPSSHPPGAAADRSGDAAGAGLRHRSAPPSVARLPGPRPRGLRVAARRPAAPPSPAGGCAGGRRARGPFLSREHAHRHALRVPRRAAGPGLTPCNVRCSWPPSAPSTSPRRSTTSTRPRIWGTRTRRSPPT